jgi:hypothetical protein
MRGHFDAKLTPASVKLSDGDFKATAVFFATANSA